MGSVIVEDCHLHILPVKTGPCQNSGQKSLNRSTVEGNVLRLSLNGEFIRLPGTKSLFVELVSISNHVHIHNNAVR